ncbi:MAG: hypothetical protein ABI353_16075 [Isosphaeraceae bacterium]
MMRRAFSFRRPALVIAIVGLGLMADQAEAQWGGGYGGYGGYGGMNMGMSLYEQNLVKDQMAALNASRFNLQNAQTVKSYEAANLLRHQAVNTELSNMKLQMDLQERYNASPKAKQYAALSRLQGFQQIPFDQMVSESGKVNWPNVVPPSLELNSRREAAEQAIEIAVQEARQTGQASVQSVNQARELLIAYGRPTLSRLHTRTATNRLKGFLVNLDAALEDMATPPPSSGEMISNRAVKRTRRGTTALGGPVWAEDHRGRLSHICSRRQVKRLAYLRRGQGSCCSY